MIRISRQSYCLRPLALKLLTFPEKGLPLNASRICRRSLKAEGLPGKFHTVAPRNHSSVWVHPNKTNSIKWCIQEARNVHGRVLDCRLLGVRDGEGGVKAAAFGLAFGQML